MEAWLVGGTLALIVIAYVVWDFRNSLTSREHHSEGGSDGSNGDSGGGDGD